MARMRPNSARLRTDSALSNSSPRTLSELRAFSPRRMAGTSSRSMRSYSSSASLSVRSSRMGPSLLCAKVRQAIRTSDCRGPLSRFNTRKPRPLSFRDRVLIAAGQIDAPLPDERCCRLFARAPAIDQRGGERRPSDAVTAVDTAGGFARGEQAINRGPAVYIHLEAAKPSMASRRHLQWRFANVDSTVKAGLVDVRNLFLDDLHGHLGCIHEDAASGAGTAGVDFLGHGPDHLGASGLLRGVGEIVLEELFAFPISEHCAGVNEAGGMWRETE